MRPLRCLVAAFAVASALLAVPAGAEPGTFVLTGTRSGWVDVTIPGEAAFQIAHATITTSGRFGGFYAEQRSSTLGDEYVGQASGIVALRDVTADGSLSRPEPMVLGRLSPGVIRFYLVADGPTTVTFDRSQGLPERTVRPVRRTSAAVSLTPLRRAGDTFGGRAPLVLPKRSVVSLALRADGERTRLAEPAFCVTRRGGDCPPEVPLFPAAVSARDAGGPPAGASYWLASYHAAYLAGGGARDARWSLAVNPAAAVSRAVGVRFVLTLA